MLRQGRFPVIVALVCSLFLNADLVAFQIPAAGAPPSPSASPCSNSLYDPQLVDSPYNEWTNDTAYTITKKKDPSSNLDLYYVSGDIIHIDEDDFPSLKRTQTAPNTGVKAITFDARVLIVDMPVIFDSSLVTMSAERIVFTSRGSVVFTTMPQAGGDGLLITADELDLTNAKTRPFQFQTDNWAFLTNGAEQPWPQTNKRTISVSANRIDSSDPYFRNDLLVSLRNLTLDQKYGYAPGNLSRAPYSVHVSDDVSAQQYSNFLRNVSLWPDEFASKVARHFARAPYEAENIQFLREMLIRPYLQKFAGYRTSATLKLTSVASSMNLGLDSFGHSRYYVPRLSMDTLLDGFSKNVTDSLKIIEAWDKDIVTAFVGGSIDATSVERQRKMLDSTKTDLADQQDKLGKALASLDEKEQKIGQQLSFIDNRRQKLAADLAALIAKAEENKKLAVVTRVVAVAASLIPASAPVAMAVGQAALVGGDLVYAHNAGEAVTPQSLITVVQSGVDFGKKVRAFRDSWDTLHTAIEKTQDPNVKGNDKRAEVNNAFRDAATNFGDKAKAVYDLLQVPEPTPLTLNDLEKRDDELQTELRTLATLRSEESDLLTNIADLKTDVVQKAAAVITAQQQFYEILESTLRNDNYIARQKNLALQIRDRFFEELAYEATILRRAYVYHTGNVLAAPADIVFFADDYRAVTINDVSYDRVEQTLAEERSRALKTYQALEQFIRTGLQNYLDSRTKPAITARPLYVSSQNINDAKQVEFLKVLNERIKEGAAALSTGSGGGTGFAFYVPFEDFSQAVNLPTKLLHIQITSVTFENKAAMAGKTIETQIFHPGFGFVTNDRGCFAVDLRKSNAQENPEFYATTLAASGPIDLKDVRALYSGSLAELTKYAKYPFNSRYFITVEVKGSPKAANWKQIPVIKQLEIMFYSVQ